MTKYDFIKWMVVNTTHSDPLYCTDKDATYWTELPAATRAADLMAKYPEYNFTPVQVIVHYEPIPVPGINGDNGGSNPIAFVPISPQQAASMIAIYSKFLPQSHEDKNADHPGVLSPVINQQKENPTNG